MVILLKDNYTRKDAERYCAGHASLAPSVIERGGRVFLALNGAPESAGFDAPELAERVLRDGEAFLCSGREFHREDTVIDVGGVRIGRGFVCIAGPCAVESAEQLAEASAAVAAGADILRAGAYKPRTSPYTFTGLGGGGLALLAEAKRACALPVVSEITDAAALPLFRDVDILQVGAKNMQNFELLRALGAANKPVLLKRGSGSTIDELLLSAEYIMSRGNERVILCERGIRTFEPRTRFTLDLSAVPVIKRLSHLPVIVDPSHAAGDREYVAPLAIAAAAIGADGIMVEVHPDPERALSDGRQAVTPEAFKAIAAAARAARRTAYTY